MLRLAPLGRKGTKAEQEAEEANFPPGLVWAFPLNVNTSWGIPYSAIVTHQVADAVSTRNLVCTFSVSSTETLDEYVSAHWHTGSDPRLECEQCYIFPKYYYLNSFYTVENYHRTRYF